MLLCCMLECMFFFEMAMASVFFLFWDISVYLLSFIAVFNMSYKFNSFFDVNT